jgi:hypothetical protein
MQELFEGVKQCQHFVVSKCRMSICCGKKLTTMIYCDIVGASGMGHLEPKVCLPAFVVDPF